jgi:ATP-binding protein involved in chromosome partitioning
MKIILVTGLKGGVGKTTTSIETARALTRRGYKVGILDLDYRTPNVPIAMDNGVAQLGHTFDGDVLLPPEIEGIRVMSMAYVWPEWKCVQVSDEDAMDDVLHLLSPDVVDWGPIDYLICDTPPTSTGVVQIALEAEDVVGSLIVSHASRVSRMDTVRTIDLFREKEVPIVGLVCNQAGLHDLDSEDIRVVAEQSGIPFFISVPHVGRNDGTLDAYFDQIGEALLNTAPITLKVKEVEDTKWRALLEMFKKLS